MTSTRSREVAGAQTLVDDVGLDERQAPGRKRRADVATAASDCVSLSSGCRDHEAARGRPPVGVREERRDDVGDEHRAESEQDVLDAAK